METDLSFFNFSDSIFCDTNYDTFCDTNGPQNFEEPHPAKDAFEKEETHNPSDELDMLIENYSINKSCIPSKDKDFIDELFLEEVDETETSKHFQFNQLLTEKKNLTTGFKKLKRQSFDLQSQIAKCEKKLSQTMLYNSEAKKEIEAWKKKLEISGKENAFLELQVQQYEHLSQQYERSFEQLEEEEKIIPDYKKTVQNYSNSIEKLKGILRNRCVSYIQASDQMKNHVKKTWKFLTLFGMKLNKEGLLTDQEKSDFLNVFGGRKAFYEALQIPSTKDISSITEDYSSKAVDTCISKSDVDIHPKGVLEPIIPSPVSSLPVLDDTLQNKNPDCEAVEKELISSSVISLVEFDSFDEETGSVNFNKVLERSESEQNHLEKEQVEFTSGLSTLNYKVNSELYMESDSCDEEENSVENQTKGLCDKENNVMDKSNLCEMGVDSRRYLTYPYNPNECKVTNKNNSDMDVVSDSSDTRHLNYSYNPSECKVTDKSNLDIDAVSDSSDDFIEVDQNMSNNPENSLVTVTDSVEIISESSTLPMILRPRVNDRTLQGKAYHKSKNKTENGINGTASDTALATNEEIDLEITFESSSIVYQRPKRERKRRSKRKTLQNQNCLDEGKDAFGSFIQKEQLHSKEILSKLFQHGNLPEVFSENISPDIVPVPNPKMHTIDILNHPVYVVTEGGASLSSEKYDHLGLDDSKCSISSDEDENYCTFDSIKTLAHRYNESVTKSTEKEVSLNLPFRKKMKGTYSEYLLKKRLLQHDIVKVDPVILAFKSVESMRSTNAYSEVYEQSLFDALTDQVHVPDKTTLLFRLLQYLNTSKMDPLLLYLSSKDPTVLLPMDENCVVSILFKIEEENKIHLHKLLNATVNSIHQLVLAKEHFSVRGLSSYCRVFTEICKRKNDTQRPLTLCLDLLKMKHKYASYLVASIAGVWKELFKWSGKITEEEKILFCIIAYGTAEQGSLNSQDWKVSTTFLSMVFNVPDISDVQEIVEFLFEKIHGKCTLGLFSDIELLITPLVICAAYTEWSWVEEHILNKHIIPRLQNFGKQWNEKAFEVFCNIYANVFSFCHKKLKSQLLFTYFRTADRLYQDNAAVALIKIAVLQKKRIPDDLVNWYKRNEEDPRTSSIKFLFHLRTISERKELTQNDLYVVHDQNSFLL